MTALIHASQHGHTDIVGLLLKQKPNLNVQDKVSHRSFATVLTLP